MAQCEITHITTRGMRSLEHVTPSWNSKHDWKINFDAWFFFSFPPALCSALTPSAFAFLSVMLSITFPPWQHWIKRHETIRAALRSLCLSVRFHLSCRKNTVCQWRSWGWALEYKLSESKWCCANMLSHTYPMPPHLSYPISDIFESSSLLWAAR